MDHIAKKFNLKFSEEDCIHLILEFLENRDLSISQLNIERETGITNGNFSDDLLFLRQLILDGQWDHVFEFISPLESISTFNSKKVRYILNKYKYIELLCIKFEIGPFQNAENCVKKIVNCLNELEQYCQSKDDYNNFCLLLTLENFDQHPDYKSWNPSKSRMKCFNELLKYIEKFLPVINKPGKKLKNSSKGDRLIQIIIKGLLYESCLQFCQSRATLDVNKKVDFNFVNLLDETELNKSDMSLISWLQVIPPETFYCQFEDKKIDVNIEKLEKPSLVATWSEMMLTSPIKPKVFPHSATPFTRVKASDLMSKSLQSGSIDALSKSIIGFSLKEAADMSHSTVVTTQFHLNNSKNDESFLPKNLSEKTVEKMFEQGDVFNSSLFGKLSVINENDKKIFVNNNNLIDEDNKDLSLESMKLQFEQFADAQWKEFLKKKDEISSFNISKQTFNNFEKEKSINIKENYVTPSEQTGRINNKALESLVTSTPKGIKEQTELTPVDFKPMRLNFSNISSDNSNATIKQDYHNHTSKLASNNFEINIMSPKNLLSDESKFNRTKIISRQLGSNNSSLKSQNTSLDSGVVAKSSSSCNLNVNSATSGFDKNNENKANQSKPINKGLFVELAKIEDAQAIRAVEFHPNGAYYAIGSNSKTLRICSYPYQNEINKNSLLNKDLDLQPEVTLRKLKYHKGSIFCLGWNPSGELLATGSNDQTIKLVRFNQENCELLEETEQSLQMHEATVRDLCFMQDSTNNSNLLISGGAGNCKIYITDCQTATPFQAFSGHSGHILSLSTWGGAVFVSGSQDRTIRFWDLRSQGCVNLITAPSVTGQGAGGAVSSVSVDPSGRLLVSGHEDASCMLYDIRGQRVIQTFKPHNGDVRSVRFSPKAYYLLSGGYDNNVVLTDLQGDLTQPLTSLVVATHQDKVVQAKWHPTEFNFLTSSADKSAVLWALPN